jgi:hypothetical protein
VSPSLLNKIESLPPEKQAEVEQFVDRLVTEEGDRPAFPRAVLERINARREALLKEHGLFETDSILRDLREHGGR